MDYNRAPMFFNQAQLQMTEAAAERIFPKDESGPGATDLGVAFTSIISWQALGE